MTEPVQWAGLGPGDLAPDGLTVRPQDVAAFLGHPNDADLTTQAETHLEVVTDLARSYTRGAGFVGRRPAVYEIASVIVAATARMISNPSQTPHTAGSVALNGPGFAGWSLAERAALHRWRRRAG
jgi:hypothetical protein